MLYVGSTPHSFDGLVVVAAVLTQRRAKAAG